MSSLTYAAIGDLVRHRLDLPPNARLRLQSLVNTALQRLGNRYAQDPDRRQYILTDRNTTTAALTAGKADLTTLVDTNQVLLEYLEYGYIWHSSSDRPLQWKRGPDLGAIVGPFDNIFPHCWLEGRTLFTKGTTNAVLSGSLGFAVPAIPSLLTLHKAMEDDLLDDIVILANLSPNQMVEEVPA